MSTVFIMIVLLWAKSGSLGAWSPCKLHSLGIRLSLRLHTSMCWVGVRFLTLRLLSPRNGASTTSR